MSLESLLVYAAVAFGGYLLRHFGIGAPTAPSGGGAPAPTAPPAAHPILMKIASDLETVLAALTAQRKAPPG